jgi:hypothetical protein
MWLDDCRIPFVDDKDKGSAKPIGKTLKHKGWDTDKWLEDTKEPHTKGRFTPNLLVCDDMLNDGVITKSGFNLKAEVKQYRGGNFGGGKTNDNGINYGDKGTNSRYYDLDKWFDKMLYEI